MERIAGIFRLNESPDPNPSVTGEKFENWLAIKIALGSTSRLIGKR
jgi:hypothetical protein